MRITAAAIQMTSGRDRARNLDAAIALAGRAADMGAQLAALPENWLEIRGAGDPPAVGVSLDGPELSALAELARERKIYLLAGTVPEAIPGSAKVFNTSAFFGPGGERIAEYRKIHLFDISLSRGENHRESDTVEPGAEVVTAGTSFGRVGFSICYDLRFPELYRRMALDGALLFFVPAAFTLHTGRDHWQALLRARAIENLAYVVAPGQYGRNTQNRATFGRSCIIDPWGVVIAQAADEEGVAIAELDFERQAVIRAEMPCLDHARGRTIDFKL